MALSLATYEAAADGIEQLRHYVEHRPEHGESMDEQLAVATASQSCLNERSSSSSASSSSEDVRAPQLNESSTVTVQEAHIETTVDPLAMPRGRGKRYSI